MTAQLITVEEVAVEEVTVTDLVTEVVTGIVRGRVEVSGGAYDPFGAAADVQAQLDQAIADATAAVAGIGESFDTIADAFVYLIGLASGADAALAVALRRSDFLLMGA